MAPACPRFGNGNGWFAAKAPLQHLVDPALSARFRLRKSLTDEQPYLADRRADGTAASLVSKEP
jgi:hypothetical protein